MAEWRSRHRKLTVCVTQNDLRQLICYGKVHSEDGTGARSAFDGNLTAMRGNDLLDDTKSYSAAPNLRGQCFASAKEGLEDMINLALADAHTTIFNRDPDDSLFHGARLRADADPTTRAVVFNRIGNEILHNLLQSGGVALHWWQVSIDNGFHFEISFLDLRIA